MTISSLSSDPSVLAAMATNNKQADLQNEVGITMLKKANDQMTQQGEALINMISQTGPAAVSDHHLDAYA